MLKCVFRLKSKTLWYFEGFLFLLILKSISLENVPVEFDDRLVMVLVDTKHGIHVAFSMHHNKIEERRKTIVSIY